ncbi:MAG TPA: hypothetical protein VFD27_02985 [Chthoniobacteraceae bacterium]|nr:hypothetical protein [Chthoniobacteraceae bacterium]
MSDERYSREPGEDDEPYEPTADRTYIDPKPRSWYGPAPKKEPFDLTAECERFLDEYCAKFGILRHPKKKPKAPQPVEPARIPTAEDWEKIR